jgi:hypothetical protein
MPTEYVIDSEVLFRLASIRNNEKCKACRRLSRPSEQVRKALDPRKPVKAAQPTAFRTCRPVPASRGKHYHAVKDFDTMQ